MKFVSLEGGAVVAIFSCAQDPEHWPNVVEVGDEDPRYLAYIAASNAAGERAWRDAELSGLVWLRDRHRDQLEIGVPTTLLPDQFAELLVFMQALRDWPQSQAFPDAEQRPVAPAFLSALEGMQ